MDVDLRAAVLAGIDQRMHEVEQYEGSLDLHQRERHTVAKDARTALRHLREIAEKHRPVYGRAELPDEAVDYCEECRNQWIGSCPTIRRLAPDYAPEALARRPFTTVAVEIDPADIARVYEPGTCAHPEGCPCTQRQRGR